MDEGMQQSQVQTEMPRKRRGVGSFFGFVFDRAVDNTLLIIQTLVHEMGLFFGTALVIIGVFGFESDKYCDGNTADYLSCTRPSTYYFYDSIDIALIVVGVFFILVWILNRKRS